MIQSLTKITPYTLKRIAFTTSRASKMKARAKKALSINLHSENYIRILQMLETQLKRNKKENSLFYHSLLHLSSMTLPCGHDSCHLPVLHTSQMSRTCGAGAKWPGIEWDYSGVEGSWQQSEGTTLASAHALCLDLLSRVWLRISGGLNCCQESWRGVI